MQKPLSPKTLERKYAQLGLSKATIDLLHKYFLCFSNLYGIISLRDAWEVFKHYEGTAVRRKDLIAFSGIVQREADHPYTVFELKEIFDGETTEDPLERMIVNNKLVLSGRFRFAKVFAVEERQSLKPLYLPDRQTFLSFTEDRFYLTPIGRKMRTFVEELKSSGFSIGENGRADGVLRDTDGNSVRGKRLSEFVFITKSERFDIEYHTAEAKRQKLEAEYRITAAEKILKQIQDFIMAGDPWGDYSPGEDLKSLLVYLREDFGVDLSRKQFEQFSGLYETLNNSSNLWQNNGWSPDALYREIGSGAPRDIYAGPNMKKLFASGELDAEETKRQYAAMGFRLIIE